MIHRRSRALAALALILLGCALAGPAAAETNGRQRAAWLRDRGGMQGGMPGDTRHFQSEIGGVAGSDEDEVTVAKSGRSHLVGLKILSSAILPGTGELMLGYKRGWILIAADLLAWSQVIKNNNEGDDMLDAYYTYADQHYDDRLLVQAYHSGPSDPYPELADEYGNGDPLYDPWGERRAVDGSGLGGQYFKDSNGGAIVINDISELDNLPLYVSKEDDRREYYENLGKWDQFVFGWDDFTRPGSTVGSDPTYVLSDLSQAATSAHRQIYREMRAASNDAYKERDRWLYVNIGLRVFSVVQTAWLGGLLGGDDEQMAVAGHPIQIAAQPYGPYKGRVSATVWF